MEAVRGIADVLLLPGKAPQRLYRGLCEFLAITQQRKGRARLRVYVTRWVAKRFEAAACGASGRIVWREAATTAPRQAGAKVRHASSGQNRHSKKRRRVVSRPANPW